MIATRAFDVIYLEKRWCARTEGSISLVYLLSDKIDTDDNVKFNSIHGLPLLVINYLANSVYEGRERRLPKWRRCRRRGSKRNAPLLPQPFAFLVFLSKSNAYRVLVFFSPLVLEGRINEAALATRQGACRFEVIKPFTVR